MLSRVCSENNLFIELLGEIKINLNRGTSRLAPHFTTLLYSRKFLQNSVRYLTFWILKQLKLERNAIFRGECKWYRKSTPLHRQFHKSSRLPYVNNYHMFWELRLIHLTIRWGTGRVDWGSESSEIWCQMVFFFITLFLTILNTEEKNCFWHKSSEPG